MKTTEETTEKTPLATSLEPNTFTIDRLLKLREVLSIVPISSTRWYEGIKTGIYPSSVCIGYRAVAWRATDIKALVEGFTSKPTANY